MPRTNRENLAKELRDAFKEEVSKGFPYADCRKLLQSSGTSLKAFIPDLDIYFSDIAGYCSCGPKIIRWPDQRIRQAIGKLEYSFFEKYPEYKVLEPLITKTSTPDLYRELVIYGKLREKLLSLLMSILSEPRSE